MSIGKYCFLIWSLKSRMDLRLMSIVWFWVISKHNEVILLGTGVMSLGRLSMFTISRKEQ